MLIISSSIAIPHEEYLGAMRVDLVVVSRRPEPCAEPKKRLRLRNCPRLSGLIRINSIDYPVRVGYSFTPPAVLPHGMNR